MAPFNAAWFKHFRLRLESAGRRMTLNPMNPRRHRLGLLFLMLPVSAFAIAQSLHFDIPAQPLPTALKAFADQAKIQLLYRHDAVKGATGNAVVGDFDTRDALQILLKGTGLEVVYSKDNAATIRPMQTASKPAAVVPRANEYTHLAQAGASSVPSSRHGEGAQSADEDDAEDHERARSSPKKTELEEIIVTGTNIRGVHPSSSPVEIYTAEEIRRTGATTTEQFLQKLPQNLATRTQNASTATTNFNRERVNGVDLRGLGVGTTLVLMNGRRMSLASAGQTADISLIPLSAVERIEVLTDGASAIYGSDAVGGVVNFVLRDDMQGAQTELSYGGVTSGSLRQERFTQALGHRWGSGNALLTYDYQDASPLKVADRDFAAGILGNLTPSDLRRSSLATFSQDVGERLSINSDLVFSRRDNKNVVGSPSRRTLSTTQNEATQLFANLGADLAIGDSLNASLLATYSDYDAESDSIQVFTAGTRPPILDAWTQDYAATDVTAKLDGSLFALPAGQVRFSFGAGYLDEQYTGVRSTGTVSDRDLGRTTSYAFGELLLPLIHDAQGIPLVRRLELSLAARYTRYDDASSPPTEHDFGDSTSPKVGLLWAPTQDLNVRATYGESFRAPSLSEIDPTARLHGLATTIPVAGAAAYVLALQGPSTQLAPETAKSFTFGVDLRPRARPGFALGVTYFNIDYDGRIARGDPSGFIASETPQDFPDVIFQTSSAALVEQLLSNSSIFFNEDPSIDLSDPAGAAAILTSRSDFWIYDNRHRNLSLSKLDGFDLTIADTRQVSWGQLTFGAQATRIFDYREQTTVNAPIFTVVDTVTRPVSMRGRAYAGLVRGGFDSTIGVNYVDDYENPLASGGPQGVESWTTVDWSASYDFGENASTVLDGLRIRLSVQNLFDEDPPFVQNNGPGGPTLRDPVGFDPANANPLGRLVVLDVSKSWGR